MDGVARLQIAHPLYVLAGALLLAGLSIWFTFANLGFETSQRALISQNNRLMQLLKLADHFSDLDAFIVAVENRNTRRTLAFVQALAPRLEADRGHFDQVFFRVDPAHFRPWALLYLPKKDLLRLRGNLKENQGFIRDLARSPGLVTFFEEVNNQMASKMVGELFTGFLQSTPGEASRERLDLGFLVGSLKQLEGAAEGSGTFSSPWTAFFMKSGWSDETEEGYFWTEKNRYLLLFITPGKTRGALAALRETISRVNAQFPDISVGVTGPKALDEDEKNVATRDIVLATAVSLAALAILLVSFWRGVVRPALEMVVLLTAMTITFGLATLFVGHLNLLSVTFAPMLLGLGIDYGIHWFARYSEEYRRAGASTGEALRMTMMDVGPAILLAGLSTALAFFPLVITGFRGLAELGLICTVGLVVATLVTLCLLPALIVLFDRPGVASAALLSAMGSEAFLILTKPRVYLLLILTSLGLVFSIWGAIKVKFDLNMLNLQSKHVESVIWEKKLVEASKYASIYGVLFASSLEEVNEKTRALKRFPNVSKVQSIEDFLPADQEWKTALLHSMKPLLAGTETIPKPRTPVDVDRLNAVLSRIRFKMDQAGAEQAPGAPGGLAGQMKEARTAIDAIRKDLATLERPKVLARLKKFEDEMIADLNDKLSLLRDNMNARPMGVNDLPTRLCERYVGPGPLYLIRVFPAGDIWDPTVLGIFVRAIRSVDPDATGDPVTLYVFTKQFRDDSIRAALFSLLFIFVFLVVSLRSLVLTLAAIAPLVVGALWTFGLMHAFHVDLNLANTIFLPLVIGAGVEYGVIIVQRWKQRFGAGNEVALPMSTGMGVILAGLTTTVGFGSLMISRHEGIHSLGLLTTIGSLSVLAGAVLFLPALLYVLDRETKRNGSRDREGTKEGP